MVVVRLTVVACNVDALDPAARGRGHLDQLDGVRGTRGHRTPNSNERILFLFLNEKKCGDPRRERGFDAALTSWVSALLVEKKE